MIAPVPQDVFQRKNTSRTVYRGSGAFPLGSWWECLRTASKGTKIQKLSRGAALVSARVL
jgi:hypothetical protein